MLPEYADTKIDQEEFRNEIRKSYETGIMSDELGHMIMKLCKGIIYSSRFINYSEHWKEEMVGDAILRCVKVITEKKFKVDSLYNPFSYFYSIIQNAYCGRAKYNYTRSQKMDEYIDLEFTRLIRDNPEHIYERPDRLDFELWDENNL